MGFGSCTVDEDDSRGFRRTEVDNISPVRTGIFAEYSFGDDLSASVKGVSGIEGGEVERAGWSGSSRRFPRRSVTFAVIGMAGPTLDEGVLSVTCSTCLEAPLRFILNLEVLFLALIGGREVLPSPGVGSFGRLGPMFSTSPSSISPTIAFKSSSLS